MIKVRYPYSKFMSILKYLKILYLYIDISTYKFKNSRAVKQSKLFKECC